MLKSILTSLALGVVVGLFLSGYALVKGKAVDVKTTLLFCGMSTTACLFLTLGDSLQAKAVLKDREWNDLQGSSDPLIALINADTTLCLKRCFGSVTSEYFEIHWVVNSTTFDFNTSVISLTAKKPMAANVARQEVNRIAYQYCGGHFLRSQTVGVIIRGADPDLQAKPLIPSVFLGSTGIIWAICVCDTNRVVDAFKTPHPVKTDEIYLRLLDWFSQSDYAVPNL